MTFDSLSRLKQVLDAYRPLTGVAVARLREDLLIRWTYHSNAIEGNTLTLSETKVALEGITVRGKSLQEHFEVINHKEAIEFVELLVSNREPLSERTIKDIHQLILKNIDDKNAGRYRRENVTIGGAKHVPPDALHVQEEMERFIQWYNTDAARLHPVERAARVHSEFVRIHPFVDGNGRTSRLLMNLELMKDGYPPAILPVEWRQDYYRALDIAHTQGDHAAFLQIISDIADEGFKPYWHALGLDEAAIKESLPATTLAQGNFSTDEKGQSQAPAAQLLMAMGYEYLTPDEALLERQHKKYNVLLENILQAQLQRINHISYKGKDIPFSEGNIQAAIQKLKNVDYKGIQRTSKEIYNNMLANGIALQQTVEGDTKSFTLRFVDWENMERNRFHVTLEYGVQRERSKKIAEPDVVLFVNGIPFAVLECKRADVDVNEGVSQSIRNQHDNYIPRLFIYAQLVMAFNKNKAKYATAGTQKDFWSEWKEDLDEDALYDLVQKSLHYRINAHDLSVWLPKQPPQADPDRQRLPTEQDRALYALCRPERLLELAYHFTVFDGGIKKIARYQQYFVIKFMLRRIMEYDGEGRRKGGIVWHTQGSGKSLTMVMLARNLLMAAGLNNPRIVLVSDREDLDVQLRDTFVHCDVQAKRATSGKNLMELITHEQAEVITTLVHKFKNTAAMKKYRDESTDIFVLVDESHRTQFGEFAARMRQIFPNACYFGFTGTPLLKKEKNSFEKFGELVEPPYPIRQAVADGAVVPLLYEGRHVEITQNKAAMDKWFERYTKDLSKEQKADLKRKYAQADTLNKAERVIYMRAFDINDHYKNHWQGKGLKAQLAAPDKATALKYHEHLNRIGEVSSAVIISPPDTREGHEEVEDEAKDEVVRFWEKMMKRYGKESEYTKQIINQFKHGDDPEILIVVDKLLTGFDAPRNTVLYLCRTLKDHNLLQAIGRVNRLHEDKSAGYIIDYMGALGELDTALEKYSALEGFDGEDVADTLRSIEEEVKKLPQRYSDLWDIFRTVRHSNDEEEYERLLGDKELRDDFYERLTAYTRTLDIALSSHKFLDDTDDETLARYKKDLRRFHKLRGAVMLRYAEAIEYKDYGAKIKSLLDEQIHADEVTQINKPTNIFESKAFDKLKDDQGVPSRSDGSRADQIAHETKNYITEKMKEDPAFYRKFSSLVQTVIDDFKAKRLSESEYLKTVSELQDEVVNKKRGDDIPPQIADNDGAVAYYGLLLPFFALKKGGSATDEEAQSLAADTALEIFGILQRNNKVNFWEDADAQNNTKNDIDDYFYDVLRDQKGIKFHERDMDRVIKEVLETAKHRDGR